MERLAYTSQKNSNKDNKKGSFIDRIDFDLVITCAKDAVIGAIMGIGSFMVLLATFGLSWHRDSWSDGSFVDGMVYTWNIAAKHLAAVDGIFPKQLVCYDEENGLFLSIVLLFLVALGILISFSRNRWFAIFYALLLGLPSVIWGAHPSVIAVTVLSVGIMLFFVNSDIRELSHSYRGLIYSVVLAAAAFVIMCVPAVSKMADRPQAIDNYRENVQEKAISSYYGENPLHNGDLRVAKRQTGDGTALEVTMSTPDSIYLRGFVGDVLGDDGWKPLSNATYYNNKDFFYWLKQDGFNGLGQISQAAELAEKGGAKKLNNGYYEQGNAISVKNVGADKRYAYIPYEISIEGVPETKNWGDNFLTGGKLHKVKEYSFNASTNKVSTWTNIASKFFTNKATVPEQKQYEIDESNYNEYIYKKYTYLSDEDREILDIAMNDQSGDQKRGHVEYNTAIRQIKQLISGNFTYDDKLKGYKKKKSVMENLFTEQTGYDVHFATAAVMLFRYYGIPARYVEGYLITPNDVSSGQTVIDVPRSNAHAWAEIYVDGIGFVPVEVCPNYYGLMKEADYSIGITSKNRKALNDKSKENDTDPNVEEVKTSANAGGSKIPKKVLIVLGILAGLLVLAALVLLVWKLIKKIKASLDRRKLFRKGEPREAVRAIFGRMDEIGAIPSQKAVDTGNRASYSEFKVYEEDRRFMLGEYKDCKKHRKKKNDSKSEKKGNK